MRLFAIAVATIVATVPCLDAARDHVSLNSTADFDPIPFLTGLSQTKYGDLLTGGSYIASGAFGSVWLFKLQAPCEGEVVVKKMEASFEFTVGDIRKEIRALKMFDSPNVLKLYDSLTSNKGPSYLFLEPAFGGIATDAFSDHTGGWFGSTGRFAGWFGGKEKRNTAKAKVVCMALVGTLRGLANMHSQHAVYVHRDLKPKNILAEGTGGDCVEHMTCKFLIADLGIVAVLDEHSTVGGKAVSYNKNLGGTESYKPPEVRGVHPNDHSPLPVKKFWTDLGDVWALGISLMEMIAPRFGTYRKLAFDLDATNEELRDEVRGKTWIPKGITELLLDMTDPDFLKRPNASEALGRAEILVKAEYGKAIPEAETGWPQCMEQCKQCKKKEICEAIDESTVDCNKRA